MRHRDSLEKLAIAANQNIKEREFWLSQLSGYRGKDTFPYDYNKTNVKDAGANAVKFRFSGDLFSRLMKLSKNSDDTLNVILVTGLVILLARYTNRQDITVGAPIFRQEIDTRFINTVLVLRTRFKNDTTVKELLLLVRETIIEAAENQNYPLEILLKELNIPDADSRGNFPLFDAAILLENIQEKKYLSHIKLNMIFSFLRTGKYVEGTAEFNPLLYEKDTIERIVEHFSHVLREGLVNLDKPVFGIDILSAEEKEQLLYDFNDNRTDYPGDRTIHELFAEQVERNGDSTAVVCLEQLQITYRELNRSANRLAHLLRKKGVRPGAVVGIMMGRSPGMIAAIMAVLKCGAAYMPIDPGTPGRRLTSMLEDGNVSILLTKTVEAANYAFTDLQERPAIRWKPLVTAPRPQITDFDRLPIPDRTLINFETYSRYIGQGMIKYSVNFQATRGCPYNCKYCCRVWPRRIVSRSAENILAEIRLYYNIGIRRFVFIDDVFNLDIRNSMRFLRLIIREGLKVQLAFPSGLRGDILTREYVDLLIEAGAVCFPLALETASPRLQKLVGKNLDIEKLRQNLEYIIETHPHVILELHTMHGFPTETEKEAMMTLDFIKSLEWVHFPYIHILRIFSNTEMEKLALESGISKKAIHRSRNLAYHELPDTLPFDKSFTLKYQADFFNNYFLSRERLLQVLPYQMKGLTEDEIIQKYNSYLPVDINSFSGLLDFFNIKADELGTGSCLDDNCIRVPGLNEKIGECFPVRESSAGALRVLLLDLSQLFSRESEMIYDVVEQPLGLMYLMAHLNRELGNKICGKIAKSRIDFDNYGELKALLDEFKPDVIGIRSLTFYMDLFHKTVALVRQWGIDAPVIAGGPYATSNYQTILQDGNVDVVVLGEGEYTFCQLIERMIENGRQLPGERVLKEIKGIAFVPGRTGKMFSREIIMVDEIPGLLSKESPENPRSVDGSGNLAYIMFTSGSTGRPKGILTTHRNVIRVVRNTNYIDIREDDRLLQLSNYAFDGSVFDIFGSLLNGAALVMVGEKDVFAVDKLADIIKKEKITVFFVTTALFNTLVDLGIDCLAGIRKILFGGEKVSVDHSRRALQYMGKGRILHVYGPTETTVYASYYPIDEIGEGLGTIPIGRPIANTGVYILNNELKPVPPGVSGIIYIGGDGVAAGYLNNAERTAEAFIDHPFKKDERLYNSGDLGRWLPAGNIEFLGRRDGQVKIRGFRIELGEIESHLLNLEGINKAAVVVREDQNNDKYLCAYIAADKEYELTLLKENLSGELPDYLIPSYVVHLEAFPLNPNGKIDKEALPLPEIKMGKEYAAPGNRIEEKLVEIWSGVLGIEKDVIGIDTDFFTLGGHSLKATVMAARIHKTLDVKIALTEVFETPTIRRLAEYINRAARDKHISIEAVEEKEYFRLSSAQKRLYILHRINPDSVAYNMPGFIPIEGAPDMEKLENTFRGLIERHESLRTSFAQVGKEPVERIHEDVDFAVGMFASEDVEEIAAICRSFIRPFDLSRSPLLRAGVIKSGKGKYLLMVDMHHIISDGVSHEIMTGDFMALYRGEDLPPLKLRYKDYVQWQNSEKEREARKKQEEYWLKEFAGEIPSLDLPADHERTGELDFRGSSLSFQVDGTLTGKIKKYALEMGVTLMMFLLSVYKILLSKYTEQEEIMVGTVIAGRRHADLENIMGFFVNMLVIKTMPSNGKPFSHYLMEVKEKAVNAYENQDYQFEELVSKLEIERQPGRHPLVDAIFVFRDESRQAIAAGGPGTEGAEGLGPNPLHVSHFDLMLHAVETREVISITIEYRTSLFKSSTIEKMAKRYIEILEQVIENREILLQEITTSHDFLDAESTVFQDDREDWDLE